MHTTNNLLDAPETIELFQNIEEPTIYCVEVIRYYEYNIFIEKQITIKILLHVIFIFWILIIVACTSLGSCMKPLTCSWTNWKKHWIQTIVDIHISTVLSRNDRGRNAAPSKIYSRWHDIKSNDRGWKKKREQRKVQI